MRLAKLGLIFFLLIKTSTAFSQQNWTSFNKSIIDTVTAIEFDNDFIWLGTNNGIVKYYTLNGVTEENTWDNSISYIYINDIAVDHYGIVWIATSSGIMSLENKSYTSYDISEYQKVIAVEVDKNNNKWFITEETVVRYDGERWQEFSVGNGLPAGSLATLVIDNTDTIWIGTHKNGMMSFDGEVWTLHDMYNPNVVASTVDSENRVWFGDYQGKVYSFDGKNWTSVRVISKLWFLISFDIDKDGVIWASSNKGLYRFENGESTVFTEEDGLETTLCKIVKVDDRDDRTVWTVGIRGLTQFDGNSFSINYPLTGPANKTTKALVVDHNNIKWFGHQTEGISRYDDISWNELCYKDIDVIGENIAVDSNNIKWFSAEPGYVLSFDNNTFILHNIYALDFYGSKCLLYAQSIAPAIDGRVWIFAKGVCVYHYVKLLCFNGEKQYSLFKLRYTYNLAVDSKNQLWQSGTYNGKILVGTEGTIIENVPSYNSFKMYFDNNDIIWIKSYSGAAYYNGTTWIKYTADNSPLPSSHVYSLAFDQNNTKWIGTDAGVSRFDGETWTTFNTKNSGIASNTVYSIAVEKNNTIWFGTDNGVSKYTGEVMPVSVDEEEKIPEAVPLIKTYPNPFNPATTIEFSIPQNSFATLAIYNIAGQKVKELIAENMTAGTHSAVWDGKDESGEAVSAGIYITRLKAGKQVATGKMLYMK